MTDTARRFPYIWPTWLTGLLAGEKHCEWAAWFKCHFEFAKRQNRGNDLAAWTAEHAEMVRARTTELIAEGWTVMVEAQNKFHLLGKTAKIGGAPDIVAVRNRRGRVEDCKTGKERDADYWQVAIYMFALPRVFPEIRDLDELAGAVVYKERIRHVDPSDLLRATDLIVERIRRTADLLEPRRTPSADECRFCDVASCPERVEDAGPASGETKDF